MKNDLIIAQKLLIKDFNISDPGLVYSQIDELQRWLSAEIGALIDHDVLRLMNLLYRIDVNETKLKLAFASDHPAWEIAGLVIERELKKVETRKKYRES